MLSKKQTIKTVILVLLCTTMVPAQGFINFSQLWQSFKQQSSRVHILAGFSVAATFATAGWLIYRYKYQKPAAKPQDPKPKLDEKKKNEPKRDEPAIVSVKKPEPKAVPRNGTPTVPVGHNPTPGSVLDLKYSKELLETSQTPQTLPQLLVQQPPVNPRQADDGARVSKPLNEQAPAAAAPTPIATPAPALISIINPPAVGQSDESTKADIGKLLHEMTSKIETDSRTQELADQKIMSDRMGLAIEDISARLIQITRTISNEQITAKELSNELNQLEEIREITNSFNVMGTNLDQEYSSNFQRVAELIKPKEAYEALYKLEVLRVDENSNKISAETIKERINKKLVTVQNGSQEYWCLRQLGWIFRTRVSRETYDAYIFGMPLVSLTNDMKAEILDAINRLKNEIQEKLAKITPKGWVEEWLDANVVGNKNPSVSTRTLKIELGQEPFNDNATSIINPENPKSNVATAYDILMGGISAAAQTARNVWNNNASPRKSSSEQEEMSQEHDRVRAVSSKKSTAESAKAAQEPAPASTPSPKDEKSKFEIPPVAKDLMGKAGSAIGNALQTGVGAAGAAISWAAQKIAGQANGQNLSGAQQPASAPQPGQAPMAPANGNGIHHAAAEPVSVEIPYPTPEPSGLLDNKPQHVINAGSSIAR